MLANQKLPIFYIAHSGPPAYFTENSEHHKRLAHLKKIIDPLKPQIKCVIFFSAHYESQGTTLVLGVDQLKTVHDHGFKDYFNYQYSPKGDPKVAQEVSTVLNSAGIKSEVSQKWGADHALWMVMGGLYLEPQELNIVAISVDLKSGEDNVANVGRALSGFREKGCLLIGSGSLSHNFDVFRLQPSPKLDQILIKIAEFDQWCQDVILNNNGKQRTDKLLKFRQLSSYKTSHPSDDHWLPIVFVCAAGENLTVSQVWKGADTPGFYCHSYMFI